MTAEAILIREAHERRLFADAAVNGGEAWQLPDGSAAYRAGLKAAAAGDLVGFNTAGIVQMPKTASMALLDGGRAFWDHSARKVFYKKVNDRDFYLGRVVGDYGANDAACAVALNVDPRADVDLLRDAVLSVPVGTQAVGGFGFPKPFGGAQGIELTATSEAQKIDLLSVDRWAVGANAIAEYIIRLGANGSTSAVDLNLGVANDTHATDADAIAQHVFFHVDGGALDILAQSKDGTTTVAAVDTTIDITAGAAVANRFEFWIDTRNPADVKLYINAVRVLSATTFRLDAATGPLGLLVHLEKTTGTATAGPVYIDRAVARFMQQDGYQR